MDINQKLEDLNYYKTNRQWPTGKIPNWIRDSRYWKDEDCMTVSEVIYFELLETANYLFKVVNS